MAKSSSRNHRSGTTGRFVKAGRAAGNRAGHQAEPRGRSGNGPGSPHRSTKTGRYVTEAHAQRHPNTTVREE